jgi:hypothetical protein
VAVGLAASVGTPPALARRHAPAPTPSPTPVPPDDPAVTLMARRQFVAWQAGRIDRVEYAASLNAQIPDAKLESTSTNLGTLGALDGVKYLGPRDAVYAPLPAGIHVYLYDMLCANGSIYEQLTLDANGKVVGIEFTDTIPTPSP